MRIIWLFSVPPSVYISFNENENWYSLQKQQQELNNIFHYQTRFEKEAEVKFIFMLTEERFWKILAYNFS